MSNQFDRKKVMPRYRFIAYVALFLGLCVVGKAAYVATVKRNYWLEVAENNKAKDVPIPAKRGNIYSCDGQLLSSTLPEYELYIDFNVCRAYRDKMWKANFDKICKGLHDIFPDNSEDDFRKRLQKAYDERKCIQIVKYYAKFEQLEAVKKLPVFDQNRYRGGFTAQEVAVRERFFGSLAKRTVGEVYTKVELSKEERENLTPQQIEEKERQLRARLGRGRSGLEESYDSILCGKPGLKSKHKVFDQMVGDIVEAPVDGKDIVTTIDVGIQDLAERSLVEKMKELDNVLAGVAIVMEVKTGDVKAMVNMTRCGDGSYQEIVNHAVSALWEPGSVFKPASMMVVLDDGMCDTTYTVDTGAGVYEMYGSKMTDHNRSRGGYHVISMQRAIEVSSNIGVSRIVDHFYHDNPEKFVAGLHRIGMGAEMKLPFKGYAKANIRDPKKNASGQYVNWWNTALPWMSIGYETQVPPIYTCTFYNGIANNGVMLQPRFVKQIMKDGKVEREEPIVVLRKKMCGDVALKKVQNMLYNVVHEGLGKQAGSPNFKVAGKTGTAQVAAAHGAGYKSGRMNYLVSFVGYFPADNPRYTCMVCIRKEDMPASGGGMCGPVFKKIAEGIMAKNLKMLAADAKDSASVMVPEVKSGNLLAADYVLNHLKVNTISQWNGSYASGNPIWGKAVLTRREVKLEKQPIYPKNMMPNVIGMGARDAVFLLEEYGVKTVIQGRGKVREQSIAPGTRIRRGQRCVIKMG